MLGRGQVRKQRRRSESTLAVCILIRVSRKTLPIHSAADPLSSIKVRSAVSTIQNQSVLYFEAGLYSIYSHLVQVVLLTFVRPGVVVSILPSHVS